MLIVMSLLVLVLLAPEIWDMFSSKFIRLESLAIPAGTIGSPVSTQANPDCVTCPPISFFGIPSHSAGFFAASVSGLKNSFAFPPQYWSPDTKYWSAAANSFFDCSYPALYPIPR